MNQRDPLPISPSSFSVPQTDSEALSGNAADYSALTSHMLAFDHQNNLQQLHSLGPQLNAVHINEPNKRRPSYHANSSTPSPTQISSQQQQQQQQQQPSLPKQTVPPQHQTSYTDYHAETLLEDLHMQRRPSHGQQSQQQAPRPVLSHRSSYEQPPYMSPSVGFTPDTKEQHHQRPPLLHPYNRNHSFSQERPPDLSKSHFPYMSASAPPSVFNLATPFSGKPEDFLAARDSSLMMSVDPWDAIRFPDFLPAQPTGLESRASIDLSPNESDEFSASMSHSYEFSRRRHESLSAADMPQGLPSEFDLLTALPTPTQAASMTLPAYSMPASFSNPRRSIDEGLAATAAGATSASSSSKPASNGATDEVKVKKKRHQTKRACAKCQRDNKKCDESRPCMRCRRNKAESECIDLPRKKRPSGLKRGRYKKSGSNENAKANAVKQSVEASKAAAASLVQSTTVPASTTDTAMMSSSSFAPPVKQQQPSHTHDVQGSSDVPMAYEMEHHHHQHPWTNAAAAAVAAPWEGANAVSHGVRSFSSTADAGFGHGFAHDHQCLELDCGTMGYTVNVGGSSEHADCSHSHSQSDALQGGSGASTAQNLESPSAAIVAPGPVSAKKSAPAPLDLAAMSASMAYQNPTNNGGNNNNNTNNSNSSMLWSASAPHSADLSSFPSTSHVQTNSHELTANTPLYHPQLHEQQQRQRRPSHGQQSKPQLQQHHHPYSAIDMVDGSGRRRHHHHYHPPDPATASSFLQLFNDETSPQYEYSTVPVKSERRSSIYDGYTSDHSAHSAHMTHPKTTPLMQRDANMPPPLHPAAEVAQSFASTLQPPSASIDIPGLTPSDFDTFPVVPGAQPLSSAAAASDIEDPCSSASVSAAPTPYNSGNSFENPWIDQLVQQALNL
ncbi:transcription factor [Schizosaccharomyces japonicus yFS275]|uniref:Transcription factor n=1 Tax=Schizosaccharomyces japonicus (strain yFS275 / FY16936) TaxID=402676 RepID=B6K4G0_SCHJY|nr:transcription factor [Schizosaccharomyces japonicus yFS275]EEB08367.1 transcription factor [Schizosaccharomyces japonicus yFS275]